MKLIIIAVALFAALWAPAQQLLIPGKNAAEKKWIKNQDYQMKWYAVKDSTRFEIGSTSTQVLANENKLTVVTAVNVKQSKSPWIDSTIADASTLSPVYHSSYNAQRDMTLHFGKIVTGYYKDKITNTRTEINDTTTVAYFDSNLYPTLINWLPLQQGYKTDISIYDYTPGSKSGVIKASVKEVNKGIYKPKSSGSRNVWIVTVTDEIGGGGNSFSTYYVDSTDRRLWKQEINAGGRKMEMELIEK
jgi:hypothetical protein